MCPSAPARPPVSAAAAVAAAAAAAAVVLVFTVPNHKLQQINVVRALFMYFPLCTHCYARMSLCVRVFV